MSEISAVFTFATGLLLRIGLPVAITIGLVALMRHLDARWQAMAEQEGAVIPLTPVRNSGCWEKHNCAPEKRKNCPAFQYQDVPCWQVHRAKSGNLNERCLGCDVFKSAPVPVHA